MLHHPSFLDDPWILVSKFAPVDFDFLRDENTFVEQTNAFFRVFMVFFVVLLVLFPTKIMFFSMFMTTVFFVLYLKSELVRRQQEKEAEEQQQNPSDHQEGFKLLSKDSGQPNSNAGSTHMYRKPTKKNPTGNYLPTDYLEQPDALPAPPANNKEADRERLRLMEEAIIDMSPHGAKLMESINASPTERKHFEQSLRPFLTNPVTAADTNMEAFVSFLSGPGYKTRKIGKEEFAKQAPLFLS